MANKTLLVAQREFLENVRTKTFWVSIFIVPLLIGAMVGGGALLNKLKQVQRYTVLDLGDADLQARAERELRQGDMSAIFRAAKDLAANPELAELSTKVRPDGTEPTAEQLLAIYEWYQKQPPEVVARLSDLETAQRFQFVSLDELGIAATDPVAARKALNERVDKGKLYAYVVLGKDPLRSFDGFEYVSNNLTDGSLRSAYEGALTRLIQKERIRDAGIAPKVAEHIQQRVSLAKLRVDATGATTAVKQENEIDKWAPVGFVYFLFIAIMSITSLLLTNTVEEKSNRIIEVLLSSVSPGQLMHGKILGIAGTGLTIVLTWVTFGVLTAAIAPQLLGESGGMMKIVFTALKNSNYLIAFVFYFLAGYLLYAAILVALGSVCNSLKEAQNLMQPVMIMLFIPLIAMVFVTQEPNGAVARVLSFIPLFTPFTMMNRAGGPPELWEYVATSALLLVSIWFAFQAAGKIFRIGVLMTGNPPKLKEILGWLRQS
jgi:ABC-2 type transport system permease protein